MIHAFLFTQIRIKEDIYGVNSNRDSLHRDRGKQQ